VHGALSTDDAVQGIALGALRGASAHWRGMDEALGAERGCWIGVGGAGHCEEPQKIPLMIGIQQSPCTSPRARGE
jgi:hypothetical protein